MRKITFVLALALSLVFAASAFAEAPGQDRHWVCHGTGSQTNPFVLIDVPLNSAHFNKLLADGTDFVAVVGEDGLPTDDACGPVDEDHPPAPKFDGEISFSLVGAQCAEGQQGIPGFTADWFLFSKGETVDSGTFEYPASCLDVAAGPAGPAGASTTVVVQAPLQNCTSKRVYSFTVRKRWQGHLLRYVRVKASGAKVSVRRVDGRYRATVDFSGLTVGQFTSQRHIKVTARVDGYPHRVTFNENVDLCRPANGKQNAPSASGLAQP
jgi:hypothetical protein